MYSVKDYTALLGLPGFSDKSLTTHFTLYSGYVKNINSILEKLQQGDFTGREIERNELLRRLGWEYNGMKLHEIYFESLSQTPKALNENSHLAEYLESVYGSFEKFLETFKEVASLRGIGWAALVKGEKEGELFTVWFEEHNTGHLANAKVILCIDMLEHAFLLDYGTKKGDYIEAFLKGVNWQVCEARFDLK